MPGVADILTLGVAADRARVHCVLVHGRGQTPEDMEAAVIARLSAGDVCWHLPRAEGKSWYKARAVDPLTEATREELAPALDALRAVVETAGRPLVVVGFSQGACVALELAFDGAAPDAVVAFTGCRVGVAGDVRPEALLPGMPVYLTGGDDDPWIPVPAFAEAVAALGRGAARLRADLFPGRGHEVSGAEIAVLDGVLHDLAAGRAVLMEAVR